MVKEVDKGTVMLDYSNIVFIPKREGIDEIGNFWSIALLNYTIEIISVELANRLSPILPKLVKEYQAGFISCRSILDGNAIIQEVIHQTNKNRRFPLKTRFWKGLQLRQLRLPLWGTPTKRIQKKMDFMIKLCLELAKIIILVNSVLCKEIKCRRELWQGTPLFYYYLPLWRMDWVFPMTFMPQKSIKLQTFNKRMTH